MYDFQRKHGHDIDCHVLAPASTCSNTRASTFVTTRASTCITTRASMVLNGASTCSNTCASTCITTRASTCITTRASTCHYTRARLLFKNMPPGAGQDPGPVTTFLRLSQQFQKQSILCDSVFLFGPAVAHKYWTHWFCQLEVIRTIKSKLVF